MQDPTSNSTDEIKAPLATFDTIDLDDDDDDDDEDDAEVSYISNQDLMPTTTPNRSISKCAESTSSSNSLGDNSEVSPVNVHETPTATKKLAKSKNGSPGKSNSEAENLSTGSKEAYSSENNASAEEIQNRLKSKGRKFKEKSSNVKYEQIENTSDVSDQDKSETDSPLPSFKLKSQPKQRFDTDSDSSDSDSDFIRSGFISGSSKDGRQKLGRKSNNVFRSPQYYFKDLGDSDSTPYSSPRLSRPVLPPPLTKEESAIRSKRKAYEKRLQRLQVTTNPIERPRSTTPINIFGLDEYASISSPEKSPRSASYEKLKITLPLEDSYKGRSPRRSHKSGEVGDSPTAAFSFNEDLLFTHTRSAFLIQDDTTTKGQSPKKILVPPCLSPKLSPARSPRARRCLASNSKYSPRFIYNPSQSAVVNTETEQDRCETDKDSVPQNWAKFDDIQTFEEQEQDSADKEQINTTADSKDGEGNVTEHGEFVDDSHEQEDATVEKAKPSKTQGISNNTPSICSDNIESKVSCEDEILTIRIEESGDKRTCALKYEEVVDPNDSENRVLADSGENDKERKLQFVKENDKSVENIGDDNFKSLC